MSSRAYRGRVVAENEQELRMDELDTEVVLPSKVVTETLLYGPTENSLNREGIHITLAKSAGSGVRLTSSVTLASYLPLSTLASSSVKCSTVFISYGCSED